MDGRREGPLIKRAYLRPFLAVSVCVLEFWTFAKRKVPAHCIGQRTHTWMRSFLQGPLPLSVHLGRYWRHLHDNSSQGFPRFLYTASHQKLDVEATYKVYFPDILAAIWTYCSIKPKLQVYVKLTRSRGWFHRYSQGEWQWIHQDADSHDQGKLPGVGGYAAHWLLSCPPEPHHHTSLLIVYLNTQWTEHTQQNSELE